MNYHARSGTLEVGSYYWNRTLKYLIKVIGEKDRYGYNKAFYFLAKNGSIENSSDYVFEDLDENDKPVHWRKTTATAIIKLKRLLK